MGIQEDAVREALRLSPHSVRTLADEAGVSEKLLRLIRDGERNATPRVVMALAEAMKGLAQRQADAIRILQESLQREEDALRAQAASTNPAQSGGSITPTVANATGSRVNRT